MALVWIVEEGEYEQRTIAVVATSVQAAVDALKAQYPAPPYEVVWGEPEIDGRWGRICADFAAVKGFSTKHREQFDLSAYEVVG